MSPVERSGHHAGRAALVALVGVVVLFGALALASVALSGRNSPDLQLGDQTFRAGRAETMAEIISESGPLLFDDVSGRKDRPMILQHLGDDPETGWYAFLANPIDRARDCTWEWQADEELFRAKCDPDRTAPADGGGLPQFAVTVIDGQVDVDLNADARSEEDETGDGGSTTSTTAG